MFKSLEKPVVFKKALVAVFLICFTYWSYLLFASQMDLSNDAVGYEQYGSMIYKKGWIEYFKTGPNREPLYPLTVAISMRIADMLSISYHFIQKFIQIIILFSSQLLMLVILNRLRVNNAIRLLTILYFGLSPAIVNSAFCLLSEIVTYPFILAAVLFGLLSWQAIHNLKPLTRVVVLGLCASLSFVFATFCKGIFQYVFLFFLIPYLCILINSIRRRDKAIFLRSVLYIMVGILVLNSFVIQYKLMNKRFNGLFEFTDRYGWALYGNAEKRVNPLTLRILLAHLASIPGEGVCHLFFSEKECWYTQWPAAGVYGVNALQSVSSKLPKDKVNARLVSMAFKKVIEKPHQYLLFMGIEAAKMPFWESTQMGFVIYPSWLRCLFSNKIFRYGIRLIFAILTYLSIFSLTARVFRKRSLLFNPQSNDKGVLITCLFMLLIIFSYTGLWSLYAILARFSLPIAPLYLICTAYFLHIKICKK